jgi:ABC-2 type transport system ATP-binding protein
VSAAPVIDVRDLRVVRGGTVALAGLSLQVEARAVTGLLGPSGSGKTTLMRAIVGVQRLDRGEVRVLDEEAGRPSLRARVGYVTQAPSIYGDLTVRENLRYFARILRAEPGRIATVLATTALEDSADRLVSALSGGQRARASLATALLNEPALLVLDEPTVGLDPVLRRDLWETFHELARQETTLLVSSHVMGEAALCDRILLLREGRLLAAEAPEDLLARTGTASLDDAFLRLVEEQA